MANNFVVLPTVGGSSNTWGTSLNTLIQAGGIGTLTAELYNDSGTLKLSKGKIGINNGVVTGIGICIIDTITTISTAGMTAGLWHAIEVSVSGTAVTISITPIAGASDESVIDAATKAAYDYEKTGYYLTASKRLIGVVFLRTALALGRVVNCESGKLGFKGIEKREHIDSLGAKTIIYIAAMNLDCGSWNMDTTTYLAKQLEFRITSNNILTAASVYRLNGSWKYRYSLNTISGKTYYYEDGAVTIIPYLGLERVLGGEFDSAAWNAATAHGYIEWET